MNRITGFTFKASKKKHYKWPFSKDKVKRFNELCSNKVSEEELHELLEKAHIYYLDRHGLSIASNTIINAQDAKIKLAELDVHTSENKHIYMPGCENKKMAILETLHSVLVTILIK